MPAYSITAISYKDKVYPEPLLEIHQPPKTLYCRGNISLLQTPCLAVVGTRKLTSYGQEVTRFLVNDLAKANFTIVSGLALGIDAVAHESTLDIGGNTVAVLGSGVDDNSIYPKTNFRLAQKILANNGLIISEYPQGTKAQHFTFPARNRIISGLSRGVVVVEADRESGALITAKFALEQNRDVFAVPGNIFAPRSTGPNTLLAKGAKAVLTANDILEEYADLKTNFDQKNFTLSTQNSVERKILDILQNNGPATLDMLIRTSGEEASNILASISLMELRGLVTKANNTFQIK